MSLELAIQANTAAIAALTEVWGKLYKQAENIRLGVEDGTVTSTSVGPITLPLAKEAKAESKKPVVTAPTPEVAANGTPPASEASPTSETAPPAVTTAQVASADTTTAPATAPPTTPDYPAVKAAMLRAIKIHGNAPVIALLTETGVEKAQLLTPEQYPAFIAQCDALAATAPAAA